MTSRDLQRAAPTPATNLPTPQTSPARSRDPSPARQLPSPVIVHDTDPLARAGQDLPPQKRLTSAANPNQVDKQNRPKPAALNDAAGKLARSETQDNASGSNGSTAMRWPTSPRLKSPPANGNPRRHSSSVRPVDLENGDSEHAHPPSRTLSVPVDGSKSPVVGPHPGSGAKPPRGFSGLTSTLETVQEGDHSSSPSNNERLLSDERMTKQAETSPKNASPERNDKDCASSIAESEQEASRSKESTPKLLPQTQPPPTVSKKPTSSVGPSKVRPSAEGSSKNMTVETETVASIPQSSTTNKDSERNGNVKKEESGSVRGNPSSEATKARKDKKRIIQKRPSATNTKADIFEAKVTSAAEDNESDSDETFVYESNPPEARSKPSRHHSRTPSASSMRSLTDRKPGSRAIGNVSDAQRAAVKPKRSMKFASNSYAADDEGENEHGTVRAHRHKVGNNSGHHHVHGFAKDSHAKPDEESPFSQAAKYRHHKSLNSPRGSSKEVTPKSGSPPPYSRTPTKTDQASSFDFENGRSYSEQDALLGSIRAPRLRPLRQSPLRQMEFYGFEDSRRSYARRCAGCIVVASIVIFVLLIACGFLFATTHPLYDVKLLEIQNVLATEKSLMADLKCTATNPNVVPIAISDMDVNVFAKSKHLVGNARASSQRRHLRTSKRLLDRHPTDREVHVADNVDDGTDPPSDAETLLLGRIFHFDSALAFEASPLRHLPYNATGEMRLTNPGNTTDEDNSKEWERILEFPFELIVRGVLKYTLPFSDRIVTASIGKTITVDPDDDDGSADAKETKRLLIARVGGNAMPL